MNSSLYRGPSNNGRSNNNSHSDNGRTTSKNRASNASANKDKQPVKAKVRTSTSRTGSRIRTRQVKSVSPARALALKVTSEVRKRGAYTHELLEKELKTSRLSKEDKAFASVLSFGVAMCLGSLDIIINKALNSPRDIDENVRDALRISTYELYYLGKQDHAAVDQGVELVRSIAPRADKLANAVLRKLVANKAQFPFGDPKTDTTARALLYAFPEWLTLRLEQDLGSHAAQELMKASNEQAPLFISINAARATQDAVLSIFDNEGVIYHPQYFEKAEVPSCYLLENSSDIQKPEIAKLLDRCCILVSDLSAQIISLLALPEKYPSSFLEIGAGRGTKTLLLQSGAIQQYGKQMHHVTLDNHAFKSKLLEKRAKAAGIHVAKACTYDATKISPSYFVNEKCGVKDGLFDAVFIDAPCSGLGTLRRHPEIRWHITQDAIDDLACLGLSILSAASTCVNAGGMLVYSTCTVTKAENEEVIMRFLNSEQGKNFQIIPIAGHASFSSSVRSGSSDAHFCVCLKRKD